MNDITSLLRQHAGQGGDRASLNSIVSQLYPELRRLAHARLVRHKSVAMLDTTVMVNEAYERLCRVGTLDACCRGQFMAYAAQVMRSILVDYVRGLHAERRGGDLAQITLSTNFLDRHGNSNAEVEQVHDALLALENSDPRLQAVVEMKYFGGFSEAEIAEALGLTERTVRRDWVRARHLLRAQLRN